MTDQPTFLGLFEGIGGLSLGLERAGWACVGQVEIDPYCRQVLAKHWPQVPRWGDIREVNPDELPRADLVCAGFPCQPVSLAGRGLAQEDPRWLWPEVARLVRHLRPRWVLLENVPGLLARGMGDVLGELATLGYDTEWDCISAADLGAPHLRKRIWIVAHPSGGGCGAGQLGLPGQPQPDAARRGTWRAATDPERVKLRDEPGRRNGQGRPSAPVAGDDGAAGPLADTNGQRQSQPGGAAGQEWRRAGNGSEPMADADSAARRVAAAVFAGTGSAALPRPASAGSGRRTGADNPWTIEPDVGRVAHGVPARLDRLRALGNAVVPQVAEHIGRLILAVHHEQIGGAA